MYKITGVEIEIVFTHGQMVTPFSMVLPNRICPTLTFNYIVELKFTVLQRLVIIKKVFSIIATVISECS